MEKGLTRTTRTGGLVAPLRTLWTLLRNGLRPGSPIPLRDKPQQMRLRPTDADERLHFIAQGYGGEDD